MANRTVSPLTVPERIDQVIPSFASRDAIGQHTLASRDVLRSMGFDSEIYYANASSDMLGEGRPLDEIGEVGPTDRWLLYQLSIGSPAADVFARRPEHKLVTYHNITPFELLRSWEPEIAEEVRWGRVQMAQLAPIVQFAMAVSAYDEGELRHVGYRSTAVAPLLIDLDGLRGEADPALARRLAQERAEGGHDLLFVGKVAPHKAQHDLVKALAVYRCLYDPKAKLRLVGGAISATYRRAVVGFSEALGVGDAVELAGSVSHQELIAYYRAADVFVCLSDHEGFCAPLLEAMGSRIPVVAYGAAAVPDTIGRGGIVLEDKDPLRVAAAIDRVVNDPTLRAYLAEQADKQVVTLSLSAAKTRFEEVIRTAVGSPT